MDEMLTATQEARAELRDLRAAAEQVLTKLTELPPPLPAPLSAKQAQEAIVAHLDMWEAAAAIDDCPLPELYERVNRVAPLSVGQFHDALRQLVQDRKLELHPWTGPLYAIAAAAVRHLHRPSDRLLRQPAHRADSSVRLIRRWNMTATITRTLTERAHDVLRRAGNPFRNYFARNPDDEVCARYHVAELFAARARPAARRRRSVPLRPGARTPRSCRSSATRAPARRTCCTRSSTAPSGAWQLLVTPGTYQKDTEFLEYLLFQIIDTLLGGGKQKGTPAARVRRRGTGPPAARARRCAALTPARAARPVPRAGPGPLGAQARPGQPRRPRSGPQWLLDSLAAGRRPSPGRRCRSRGRCAEAGLDAGAGLRPDLPATSSAPRRTTPPA